MEAPQISADVLVEGTGGEAAVVGAGGFESLFAPPESAEVVVESTAADGTQVEEVLTPTAELPPETPPAAPDQADQHVESPVPPSDQNPPA